MRFITVEKDVRVEILDWGGSGTPVVLLAGGGNTAHVFDEFAPRLAGSFHVVGITRRGFGASGYSASPGGLARLRDDVFEVLDALKLGRPVLVGHSIAGAELSAIALSHPERVRGLVYVEAAYPYAFQSNRGPAMQEFLELAGPQGGPAPKAPDLVSFRSLAQWDAQTYGFEMPEAEFRQTWESDAAGRPVKERDPPGAKVFTEIMTAAKRPADVPVPSLALFAIPHVEEKWMTTAMDADVRDQAAAYFRKLDALAQKQAKALESAVPSARVMRMRGMHYLFLSNQDEVLRAIRAFIQELGTYRK